MLNYRSDLKPLARQLRSNMTDAEQKLWFHLRRKQMCNVQFYRQRPIGEFIVDFYAPSKKLVIEVDGVQHLEANNMQADVRRTAFLESLGLRVMRFDNLQILQHLTDVLEMIHRYIADRKSLQPSPSTSSGQALLQREEPR
ncbi:MAG: endonuclease domain-containing protein [Betaproteobacteria bacterium]|nr:endonuclease domain-containing protein [Betaproteobacteria bacterium]